MATLIGVVSQVVGEVFAVAGDGTRRPVVEGDRVFAGEQIITGEAGAVAIAMSNGQQLTLGRDSALLLNEQLLSQAPDGDAPADQPPSTAPSESDLTDVEQLQAAIEAGVDPTVEGEATAAGPGAGGAGGAGGAAGGGHSFILLSEVGGQLDPTIGFPTEGISSGPEFPNPDPVVSADQPSIVVDGLPNGGEASNEVDEEGLSGGLAGGSNDLAGESGSVGGSLGYSFGPDGVGSFTWNAGGLPALTSGGVPLVYSVSADGLTLTASAGGATVFTLSVTDLAAGTYQFTLVSPLDHPAGEGGSDENDLNFLFSYNITDSNGSIAGGTLGITVDDDSPTISLFERELSSLVVDETDLGTDATGNFSGAFSSAFGADGAGNISYALSATGDPSGLVDVATGQDIVLGMNGGVVEGWVGGDSSIVAFTVSVDGSGNVTLDQLRALQHPDGSNPDDPVSVAGSAIALTATITDADGDQASASLNLGDFLTFHDDGPSISLADTELSSLVVDETNLAVDATADFSGAFSSAFGADGAGNISYALNATGDPSGLVDVATGQEIVLGMNGGVVEGWVGGDSSIVAFTVSVDGSGNVTLDQLRALQHPDGSDPDDPVSVAGSAIALTATITDADGDQASASLNLGDFLTFHDDGPSIELSDTELSSLVVDETNLAVDATADFSGAFSSAFGADGAGNISYALSATGDPSGLVDVATGQDIVLGMNGGVVEGWVGGDSSIVAFTVSVDGSGNVTLDQLRALQHPDGSNPDDPVSVAGSAIALTATITDADGDQASASLSLGDFLTFHDDGPSIELSDTELSSLVVDETNLAVDATADFSGAFSSAFGADGAGYISYALSATGDPSGLVDVATGQDIVFGMNGGVVEGWVGGDSSIVAFTVSVDGSGNVTLDQLRALQHPDGSNPDDPVSVAGSAIALTATITDADGDQASASLNLGGFLTFHDDGPSISLADTELSSLEVDETNLAVDATADFSGAFSSAFGADGAGSVSYALSATGDPSGLVDVATGQDIVLGMNGSVVEGWVGGDSSIVAFTVSVDGSGNVTLDQLRALQHPDGSNPDDPVSVASSAIALTATITDADGDQASASLNLGDFLTFHDDGPSISLADTELSSLVVDETNLAVDATADFSGAFSSAFGADGAGNISYALSATGDPSGLVDVATGQDIVLGMNGGVVEGWVGGDSSIVAFTVSVDGSGNVTLDQLRALQHPDGSNPDDPVSVAGSAIALTATITDADGDQASASLNLGDFLTFHDDGPSIELSDTELSNLVVDETNLAVDATADFSGAFSSAFGADGAGSVSYNLSATGDPSGLVDVATGQDIVFGMNGGVVEGWVGGDSSIVAFTVSVDGSGNVTLDQLRALQHPDGSNPDDPVSVAGSAIALTATITDADGDQASASLNLGDFLTFHDDGPSISLADTELSSLVVDETNLAVDATADFSGAFSSAFGADGAGSVSYNLSATGDPSGLVDVATGQDIVLGMNGGVVEGWVGGDSSIVAFTVSVDGSGNVTLDQLRALQHPDGSNPDDPVSVAGSAIALTATITDADGDQASASLNLGDFLTFHDDGPSISLAYTELSSLVVDETNLAVDATADFSGAFSSAFGADGAGSVSYALSATGDPSGLVDVATGQDIVLGMNGGVVEGWVGGDSSIVAFTVSVDGSGNITLDQLRALQHPDGSNPDDPVSVAGSAIALTATITDADGDQASASLNLGDFLTFHDDGPSIALAETELSSLVVDETNLAVDATADFSGAFSSAFGADGAGSVSYALSATGDPSGLMDVATGQDIVLGMNGGVVEGWVGGDSSIVAFTVSVDGSGNVTLDQLRALQHPDGSNPDDPVSVAGSAIALTATITDADGDQASASLNLGDFLTFHDDGPSIELSDTELSSLVVDETNLAVDATADFSGAFSSAFGADGAGNISYALSATGDPSGLVDVATGQDIVLGMNGGVVEGWVGGDSSIVAFTVSVDGSGNVTLDQLRALQHPDGSNPDDPVSVAGSAIALTATITDADGDQASASLNLGDFLTFHDDGPSISLADTELSSLVVDETNLAVDATADFSGAFSSAFGADGAGSVTYALSATGDPSGLVDVATGQDIVLGMNGSVVEGWVGGDSSIVAFTVSLDGSGNVTLDQLRALQHPDGSDPDDPVSVAGSAIALTATITDTDGDQASASLNLGEFLTFHDDGPSIVGTPQAPVQITGLVHEDLLSSPNTGNSEVGQTLTVTGLAGALNALVNFGADGAGGFALSSDVSSLQAQTLTSGGEALSYDVAGDTLTASVSGYDVFSLQVGADGSYTFTLLGPLDHPLADADDSETLPGAGIDFSAILIATDGDGDSLAGGFPVGSFTIDVQDDIPVLHGVQDGIMGNFAGTLQGEVDIAFGADGLGSYNLSGTPPSDAISYSTVNNADGSSVLTATVVSTGETYFILTLHADGNYDFELVTPSPTVEVTTSLIGLTAGGPVPVLILPINGVTATFTELAPTPAVGGINSSGQGMGVDNNLISDGELMKIAFNSSIANVGFTLNKLSTSDIMSWAVFSAGILVASGTWSPPAGTGESSDTVFNILDPVAGSTLNYTYGSAGAIEASGFDEMHLGSNSGDYRLLSITVSEELFPGDVDLSFDLGATDGDGDPVTAGLNITLEGDGAEASGFTLSGTAAHEVLLGGSGNDMLLGSGGDDVLIGGLGDDSLTGGAGSDSFKWLAGDHGTDTVTDFVADFNAGGDQLDLSELLVGEHGEAGDIGNLLSYIDIATSGSDTVITVSSSAVADPAAAPEQTIVLENVDLYASYGVGNEADLVQSMLGDGTLKVDTV